MALHSEVPEEVSRKMNDINGNDSLDRWPSLSASIQTLLHTPLQPELSADAKGLPSYGSLKFKEFLKIVDDTTNQEPQEPDQRRLFPDSTDARYTGVGLPNGDAPFDEHTAPVISHERAYSRLAVRNKEATSHYSLQAPTNLENLTTEEVWNRIQQEQVVGANNSGPNSNYADYGHNDRNHAMENAMMEPQRHQAGMCAQTTVEAFLDHVGVRRVGNGAEERNPLDIAVEGHAKPRTTGRSRGRPKGSKNRTKKLAVQSLPEPPLGQPKPEATVRRPRGRPKGSRNRNPKTSKVESNNGGETNRQPLDFSLEPHNSPIGSVMSPTSEHQNYSLGSENESKNDKEAAPGTVRRGRKRKYTDLSEAERKHRRMIKNRESAARSRDKRQAYTERLEEQVNELQDQNKKLRSTVMSVAHAARQLAETSIDNEPDNSLRNKDSADETRRYNLRRTRTGPW